jgi:hypothetical protein
MDYRNCCVDLSIKFLAWCLLLPFMIEPSLASPCSQYRVKQVRHFSASIEFENTSAINASRLSNGEELFSDIVRNGAFIIEAEDRFKCRNDGCEKVELMSVKDIVMKRGPNSSSIDRYNGKDINWVYDEYQGKLRIAAYLLKFDSSKDCRFNSLPYLHESGKLKRRFSYSDKLNGKCVHGELIASAFLNESHSTDDLLSIIRTTKSPNLLSMALEANKGSARSVSLEVVHDTLQERDFFAFEHRNDGRGNEYEEEHTFYPKSHLINQISELFPEDSQLLERLSVSVSKGDRTADSALMSVISGNRSSDIFSEVVKKSSRDFQTDLGACNDLNPRNQSKIIHFAELTQMQEDRGMTYVAYVFDVMQKNLGILPQDLRTSILTFAFKESAVSQYWNRSYLDREFLRWIKHYLILAEPDFTVLRKFFPMAYLRSPIEYTILDSDGQLDPKTWVWFQHENSWNRMMDIGYILMRSLPDSQKLVDEITSFPSVPSKCLNILINGGKHCPYLKTEYFWH